MSISLGIDWKNVQPMPDVLPIGEYVFTLIGAKLQEGTGRLLIQTAVKNGEFAGKPFSYTYPNFLADNGKWAIPEFKRLIIALDDEPFEGESEAAFLNRVSGKAFGGRIKHREYTPDGDSQPRTVADLILSSVRQAI